MSHLKSRFCIIVAASLLVVLSLGGTGSAQEQKKQPPSVAVTSLHQWLVDRMLSWRPPGHSFVPQAKETPADGKTRYEEIGDALISVAYDPSEKPLFSGKYGRARTLALLASISFFESGYRKDVDLGLGLLGRGDHGRSWCMMQIMLGKPDHTGQTRRRILLTADSFKLVSPGDSGWDTAYGGQDLVQDRRKCFQAGLHLVRNSFHACRRLPVEDRLSVYASGSCSAGSEASEYRVRKAQRWLASQRPPMTDAGAMRLLHPPPAAPAPAGPEDSRTSMLQNDLAGRPVIAHGLARVLPSDAVPW